MRGRRSLVRIQPGASLAHVAQEAEHRGATPGRPVRSGSSASQARGVCNGSTASSNLVSPGSRPGGPAPTTRSSRAGAVRLSGESGCTLVRRCGSTPRPDRSSRPRRTSCCGPERFRLSTPNRQVAGSSPAQSTRAPVAQLAEQFRAVQPRPQQLSHDRLRAGEDPVISHPWSSGRPRTSARRAPGLHLPVFTTTTAVISTPGCGPEEDGYRQSARPWPGSRRVQVAPGALAP